MKKQIFTLLTAMLIVAEITFAQAPQGFNYQAVIRDGSGDILFNLAATMRFTIKTGSASGSTQYYNQKV
ncbi:MAG: hypothetical protein R2764_05695 [Bacteroidales bacterium]